MGAGEWEVGSGEFEEVESGGSKRWEVGVRSPQMKMEREEDIGLDDSNQSNLELPTSF